MQLAMIGLGKMGANMATRLLRGDHQVVAYDLNEKTILEAEEKGASGARTLDGIAAYVPDSGEGRWTVAEAIELNCSIPVITMALQRRFRSREEEPFGDKLLAAMRQQFGGHAVKSK